MVFGSCERKLGFYYGSGCLEKLTCYEKIVLQPNHYSDEELRYLKMRSVTPLAYISVGEDVGPPAAWHIAGWHTEWGGFRVDPGHPGWTDCILKQARSALAKGFAGLFLDTLDAAEEISRDGTLSLLRKLRKIIGKAYILANRGFGLLPEMAQYVDGILFEAFSTTHSPDYAPLPDAELRFNETLACYLRTFGKELFSLDYADTPELEEFAHKRAIKFGFYPVISDKYLTCLRP